MTDTMTSPVANTHAGESTAASEVARLRATFATGKTQDLQWRFQQLDALIRMLEEGEDAIAAALGQRPRPTGGRLLDGRRHAAGRGSQVRQEAPQELGEAASRLAADLAAAGQGLVRLRAARRRLHRRPVELPGPPHPGPARRRDRRRQLCDSQAVRAHARLGAGGGRPRPQVPRPGCVLRRPRRCRGDAGRHRAGRRPRLLHRWPGDRQGDHGRGRSAPDPGHAGARRQVPGRHRTRCQPRGHCAADRLDQAAELGPDVRGAGLCPRRSDGEGPVCRAC